MAKGIIVGGETIELTSVEGIPIPVLNWDDHGRQFKAGDGWNKRRKKDISLIVHHWTGGEGNAFRVYRTLQKRDLGVSFVIDRNAIVQFADPLVVAPAAAGRFNSFSCSIEMVNYGFRRMKPWQWNLKESNLILVPKKGRDRVTYDTRIHGRRVRVAHFTPYQMTMAMQLADALSEALDVPRLTTPSRKRNSIFTGIDRFSGHVGHYELSKRKLDPGPAFMQALGAHFINSASVPPGTS